MKPIYSIFTEKLQELTRYSKRIDTMTATHTDSIKLQRLHCEIIDLYKDNYFKEPEYRILINLSCKLNDRMDECLRLNETVRQIERDIKKERRSVC